MFWSSLDSWTFCQCLCVRCRKPPFSFAPRSPSRNIGLFKRMQSLALLLSRRHTTLSMSGTEPIALTTYAGSYVPSHFDCGCIAAALSHSWLILFCSENQMWFYAQHMLNRLLRKPVIGTFPETRLPFHQGNGSCLVASPLHGFTGTQAKRRQPIVGLDAVVACIDRAQKIVIVTGAGVSSHEIGSTALATLVLPGRCIAKNPEPCQFDGCLVKFSTA